MSRVTHPRLRIAQRLAALFFAALAPLAASADTFPSKPIHIVVPYAAGGAVDTIARVLGDQLSKQMKAPVIVEDKPGASANIGAAYVAKAAPDGYTLLLGANGLAANVSLFKQIPYDPIRDFEPVAKLGDAPLVLVVNPSFPAKSVKELIALAKAQPGKLNYGSAGNGSSGHMASELLKLDTRIDVAHIPYKGGAPALRDLLGNRLAFVMTNPIEIVEYVKAGQLRALAVGNPKRIALLPQVPTFTEAGVPGYTASVWWVLAAPAKTPKSVVDKLGAETVKALHDATVKGKLEKMGAVVDPAGPAQASAFLRSEVAKWAKVIKAANIHTN